MKMAYRVRFCSSPDFHLSHCACSLAFIFASSAQTPPPSVPSMATSWSSPPSAFRGRKSSAPWVRLIRAAQWVDAISPARWSAQLCPYITFSSMACTSQTGVSTELSCFWGVCSDAGVRRNSASRTVAFLRSSRYSWIIFLAMAKRALDWSWWSSYRAPMAAMDRIRQPLPPAVLGRALVAWVGISKERVGMCRKGRCGWKYFRYAWTYLCRSWVLGFWWSAAAAAAAALLPLTAGGPCGDWGDVGSLNENLLRGLMGDWEAAEAWAPRIAFLEESVIVETGEVP